MDIIKFTNPTSPTKMEQAEVINGIKSKMWVERYNREGEFSLTARISSGIKDKLPIGSFISHLNTKEIMIVENHEIRDDRGKESDIIITGRGYESYFETRIIGSDRPAWPTAGINYDYLSENYIAQQIVQLLVDRLYAAYLNDTNDALPFTTVLTNVVGSGAYVLRELEHGTTLYENLTALLDLGNLGIKIIRPGSWSSSSPNVVFEIHKGVDRTSSVMFSYDSGEIVSADYLWSNIPKRTSVLVTGTWMEAVIHSTPLKTGYERRMAYLEVPEVDSEFETTPTGGDIDIVYDRLEALGLEFLSYQKDVSIVKADISKKATRYAFRDDYDVGDLVTIKGEYNATATMRVVEYVEIEESSGESGYPTLIMV